MVVGAPLASGREEQNLFTAQKKSQVYLGIGRVEYLKISSWAQIDELRWAVKRFCSLRVKYWAPKRASSGGLNWARHKLSKFLLYLTKFYLNYSKVLRPRQVLGYNFSTGKTLTMNDLWRYWRFLLIFHIYKSTITIETSCWSLKTFLSFFSRMQAERLTTAFWNAQLVPALAG